MGYLSAPSPPAPSGTDAGPTGAFSARLLAETRQKFAAHDSQEPTIRFTTPSLPYKRHQASHDISTALRLGTCRWAVFAAAMGMGVAVSGRPGGARRALDGAVVIPIPCD
ncbi:hypothetical protein CKAH01_07827 [Colletotrichum kahawae]|uniref:Uncharacterized protein n=1 Tax=Colletotrichum kahawae TaxID=34407 RepID=A0AAD9Y5J6_COLKA|nr:hypothetical protein CKAH01_07827 [Colletotrichum kahawae]